MVISVYLGNCISLWEYVVLSSIHDFAQESCWTKEGDFRPIRLQAKFDIESYGKIRGHRVRGTLEADFGIFYDPDNLYITQILQSEFPEVDWTGLVFHRTMDSSKIFIMEDDSFEEIGEIRIRSGVALDRSELEGSPNVVDMLNWNP